MPDTLKSYSASLIKAQNKSTEHSEWTVKKQKTQMILNYKTIRWFDRNAKKQIPKLIHV